MSYEDREYYSNMSWWEKVFWNLVGLLVLGLIVYGLVS